MKKSTIAAALLAAFALPSAFAATTTADVVVLMDESGSMAGEQAWMAATIPLLDAGLTTAGLTGNRYGLVGFGASAAPAPSRVRGFTVGGGQFGTAAQFTTASGGLVASGGTEDGYAAIDFANGYSFRAGAGRNYILVSDEDRDNTNAGLNTAGMLASMKGTNTLLNAVVNATFRCGDNSVALGMSSGGKGYKADGAGGFTTCTGAHLFSDFGSTDTDYVNLALNTGGAAWDLNILRAGGTGATSFTNAFIDVKVAEIIITPPPPVPEPSTYALMFAGLGVVGMLARRRKQQA